MGFSKPGAGQPMDGRVKRGNASESSDASVHKSEREGLESAE
jgi:hypothetical protein